MLVKTRALNALGNHGISLEHTRHMSDWELLNIRQIGRGTLRWIREQVPPAGQTEQQKAEQDAALRGMGFLVYQDGLWRRVPPEQVKVVRFGALMLRAGSDVMTEVL
jgi:hypothetical protein